MVESLHDQRPIRMASPTARLMGWTVELGGDPLPSKPIIFFLLSIWFGGLGSRERKASARTCNRVSLSRKV